MYHNYYSSTPTLTPPPPEETPQGSPAPARLSTRRRRLAAAALFVSFLLLIAAGTAALFLLAGRLSDVEFPGLPVDDPALFDPLPSSTLDPSDGFWNWDSDYDYSPYSTQPPATTVERYPAGDELKLPLKGVPASGAMTYQAIYTKLLPSIVGIRAYSSRGGSTGTGVVLTADGYIVTNFHVIEGASRVEVLLQDDYLYNARLVGGDRANDLAVLKVNVTGLTPAEFGDSDLLQVGDATLALGNPLGEELKNTMTDGIVSAINRDVNNDGVTMTLIQTTAALNPGNSGGALVNIYGQVIGITNMKMMSDYDTIEGLGFAIPSVTVQSVAIRLVADGKLTGRPTLGVTVQNFPQELWDGYDLPRNFTGGLLVVGVQPGSDAYQSGIREDDILLSANGHPLAEIDDLVAVKATLSVGDSIRFQLLRSGRIRSVTVRLMDQYELDNIQE